MKNESMKFKIEIDLDNQICVGSGQPPSGSDKSADTIERNIFRAIQETFRKKSVKWVDDFIHKVNEDNPDTAFELFKSNIGFFQLVKDPVSVAKLRSVNCSLFNRENRKEFLLSIIAVCSKFGQRKGLNVEIDRLLSEYQLELSPDVLQNLILEKGNVAATDGLYNVANVCYQKVLEADSTSSGTKAWAYQGLSNISTSSDDIVFYAQKAADMHLLAGCRTDAIKNLVRIAKVKGIAEPESAVQILDQAINLYDSTSLLDREFKASLLHIKSSFLFSTGNSVEALRCAEEACNLKRGLIGNEENFHASLSLAEIIAKDAGEQEKADKYKAEANSLANSIEDESFRIRIELSEVVSAKGVIPTELEERIKTTADAHVEFSVLLYKATAPGLKSESTFAFLDQAKAIAEKSADTFELSTVYFAIAEEYRKNNQIEQALSNYKKSLEHNQFNRATIQNCTQMLLESKKWVEAEEFIRARLTLLGELPNLSYVYGQILIELDRQGEAIHYLKKAAETRNVDELILKCVKGDKSSLPEISHTELKGNIQSISLQEIQNALCEFGKSISSDSRMHFWKYDKNENKYKWTTNPEELAKQLFITFFNGKFGKDSVELLQEPRAGAGFIDLYVTLKGGLKIVVELKMCGSGYSSAYALSGESQILHYLDARSTCVGYLVVFDGRIRDYGQDFKPVQSMQNNTIYTVAIDLRPKVMK